MFSALRKPQVLKLVNSAALHSAFLKSVKDYIQPLLISIAVMLPFYNGLDLKNKSGLVIGFAYFGIFLLTALASRNAGRLADARVKGIEHKTLILGLLAGLISGICYSQNYLILGLVFFILIFFIENLRKPILTGILSDNVPNEILTSVISIQSFYQTIITSILAIMIGLLADQYGIGFALAGTALLLIVLYLIIQSTTTTVRKAA